mgnify:CR=1 FL=1
MKNNIKCSICKGNLVPFGFESNDIIIWGNNPQPFNNENFPPLDFLISFYKSQKNVDQLLRLKKFIQEYPMLFELYDYKINKILSKV